MAKRKVPPPEDPEADTTPVDTTMPAVEAFAEAIAQTTHQHLAAHAEDEPHEPVQAGLFPRPPFDHRAALLQIAERSSEVADLARDMESKQAAFKRSREDWTEAAKDLQALITATTKAMRESEPEPHQLSLEGEGCAWEREHPGEVCMVCSQARAALRSSDHGETTYVDEPADQPTETLADA